MIPFHENSYMGLTAIGVSQRPGSNPKNHATYKFGTSSDMAPNGSQ